ncbi:MAG: NAD-dependent epimerase/dehydratase family protein [Candidatus Pacebacteria bacterium]|nr:NAD-dependent epimerase/dehydratase family protein [Candidatus Paceibacterota bacterium]
MDTSKKYVVFITGGAGYVGAMLIDLFSRRDDVERIIALDKESLPEFIKDAPKLTYILGNTSDPTWQKQVADAKPDIVIHTAWQIREMYGKKKLQWKWNVTGSDMVFDFAFLTPSVKKLIHFSTVASYSALSSNTVGHLFREEEGFRESDYLYAEEKRVVERHLEEKFAAAKSKGSKVQVAIIRPAAITGPRGRYMRIRFGLQAALSGQLKESFVHRMISAMVSFVPVTPKWCRQFIHEDDIADVATLLAFSDLKNQYDAFNACPPGPVVRGQDMANAVGKKPILIHPYLIRIVFAIMWNLTRGKVPTSKGGWKSYSYPIAVDGSKLTQMYGYVYKWQSKDAFVKREGRYMKYVA